ncbi:hypothetical protein DFH28DRAFT_828368, partial [Melampsora americana]
MSSNNFNDQSIWEILDTLESKIINLIHSTSDLVIPPIFETSNQLYSQLESILKQAYEKPLELSSKSDLLSNILPTSINEFNIPNKNHDHHLLLSTSNSIQPSLLNRIFKLKNIVITLGIWLTSTLVLRVLVSSDSFHHFLQTHPELRRTLPRFLLTRRRRITHLIQPRYSTGGKSRLEANQLAIQLSSAGYIVIASVSDSAHVGSLERDGIGRIKALVLYPTQPERASAFTRSLASALSLRFPLNSAGDAFMEDGSHSSLVGMVNCFPISTMDELKPVETLEP